MVFLILLASLGFGFLPYNPNREFYPNNGSYLSASYQQRWRLDKQEYISGLEYSHGKEYTRFKLSPKAGIYQTNRGSTLLSVGIKKDIILTSRVALTAHLMPTFSFIENSDKLYSSNSVNFNIGVGASYVFNKKIGIEGGIMHFSNANTRKPNEGIDTVYIKVNFYL